MHSMCRMKKRNEDHIQEQIALSISREMAIRNNAKKAAEERAERQRKLIDSKRFVEEVKKQTAQETKEITRRLSSSVQTLKTQAEMEKRQKADEERRR